MQAKFHPPLSDSKKLTWLDVLLLLVLAVAVYYSLLHRLGDAPLTLWDEARYANNAIDMLQNPHLFKVEHLDEPDWFNTKPALVIGLQALCMRVFGINEFAVRLPSALFGLLTLIAVYLFAWRFFRSALAGWLSAAILLCTPGFMSGHNVRTGDLDAALVFWLFLGLFVAVDLLVKQPKNTRKHYFLLSVSVIGGFLSKGIAGFFFLPFLLLVPLVFGRFHIYRDKNLYLGGLFVLMVCTAYYTLREYFMPGYMELVAKYEWGRYTEVVMNWQKHPFFWYLSQMADVRFYPFIYFIPLSLPAVYFFKGQERIAFVSLLFTAVAYFLLISYPEVKLLWYDAPLYPLFVLCLGLSLGVISERLLSHWRLPYVKTILSVLFMMLLMQPYQKTLVLMQNEDVLVYDLLEEGVYLRQLHRERPDLKQITIYKVESDPAHYDQLWFYVRRYTLENEYEIRVSQEMTFESGELVLLSKKSDQEKLTDSFSHTEIHRSPYGTLYQIQ